MAKQTQRDRILQALEALPEDATFDDAIERLIFLAKIETGLAELDAGKAIPHEEVKRGASFGLHKEVWEDVDVNEYIRQEREAWRESATA